MNTNRPYLAQVTDPEILFSAWEKIKTKRSQGGIDGVSVDDFAVNAERNLEKLRLELLTEKYVPEPLKIVKVPKTSDKAQTREIGLASVRDKIAQEAVRAVIEPRLEKLFLNCSYGYRAGKGTVRAIRRVSHYLDYLGCNWIVAADIDDYFNSIDQIILINQLRQAIADEAVIRLIQLWLRMGTIDFRGQWHDAISGVRLGNVIAPLLSNFYLHEFDRMMVSKNFGLVRYADDMVVLCRHRREAEIALQNISEFLTSRLKLKLNYNPRPIVNIETGFAFLGIYFQNNLRQIEPSRLDRLDAKLKALSAGGRIADFTALLHEYNETLAGWRRYYGLLLPPPEIEKAEKVFRENLVFLVASAFSGKIFQTQTAAETALENIELLVHRNLSERKTFLCRNPRRLSALSGKIPRRRSVNHPASS